MTAWFLLWLHALSSWAFARDGEDWSARGPVGEVFGNDLDARSGREVVVVDDDGAVWWTDDGGRVWSQRLPPSRQRRARVSEEAVRLDAEIRIEELIDDIGEDPSAAQGLLSDETEAGLEDALAEQESAVEQITEALQDTLQADANDAGFFSQVSGVDEDHPRARVAWMGDEVLVGRVDGLWVITPDGAASHPLSRTVTAVAFDGAQEVVVGTLRGLWRRDGARGEWQRIDEGPPRVVYDLVYDGTGSWWAATGRGVWKLDASLAQEPGQVLDGVPLKDLATDGAGRVWATDGLRLWRLDGAEPEALSHPSGETLVDVDVVDGQLRLLTASALWTRPALEDRADWGVTSVRLPAGVSPVAVSGPLDRPWIATTRGIWTLSEARRVQESDDDRFVPMPALLAAAATQTGLTARAGVGKATQAARWLVPEIVFELWLWEQPRMVSVLDRGLSLDDRGYTQWMVRAVWRPPSREVAFVDPEDLVVSVDETGTRVYSGAFDDGVLVARQARAALREGSRRTANIVALSQRRAELVASRSEAAEEDLRARVRLELGIQEIEATLDALTEGAVSRWKSAQAAGGSG